MMRMICCMQMERIDGLTEKELIIRIHMELDAPCPLRLRADWQKDIRLRRVSAMPKVILVAHFRQVLISAEGVGQSTMDGRYRKTSDLYNDFYGKMA